MILWGHCDLTRPFCRESDRLARLAEFLDGVLSPREHRRVTAHVNACDSCRRLVEEARALLAHFA
jgi:anti-sigma factor RsiW